MPPNTEELQAALQRVSGTTLDACGAANAWAGTTGLELLGALNHKAGTHGLGLDAVLVTLEQLAGDGGEGGDPQAARTKWPLQAATLSANGDAFTADALDPAWTATGVTPSFPYVSPGVLLAPAARARMVRPAPEATEYEVVAMFDCLGGHSAAHSSAVLGQWGVAILSSAGTGVSGGIHTADPARLWLHQITAYEYVGVYGSGLDPGTLKISRIALALHRNGNDYRMRSSNDGGATWTSYTAASTVAFTPAQVGFGRWHTGGSATDNQVFLRHFDVYTPSFGA